MTTKLDSETANSATSYSETATNTKLDSETVNTVKLPVSDLARSLTYMGPALSDPDYFYWCISPIEDEAGHIHLFTARWRSGNGMADWKVRGEIAHFIGDSPTGPFTISDVPIHNGNLPAPQFSPHNVRVHKLGDVYCMIYIVQTSDSQHDQKICLATAPTLDGPWTLQGDRHDGVVVEADPTGWTTDIPYSTMDPSGWTAGSWLGTDNPDIVYFNGQYIIYFKAGRDLESTHYGYAVSDHLTHGYVKCTQPITDNIGYIEDANAWVANDRVYMLTTDNFGLNSGIRGAGILWESTDGFSFQLANAQVGFGLFSDYTTIPANSATPYIGEHKFERPALLFQNGQPTYFYAPSGVNIEGIDATASYVLKIREPFC